MNADTYTQTALVHMYSSMQ